MKTKKMIIILNSNCKGGRGLEYWNKLSPSLEEKFGPLNTYITSNQNEAEQLINGLVKQGERIFIAAGGDGGLNLLINSIINSKGQLPLSEFTIGAVGLGSSNDYHKPFTQVINKIPVRINRDSTIMRDVGEILYFDENDNQNKVYFIISSSVGIVAEGNENFNKAGPFLDFLKKRNTNLAIFLTFFQTLRHFQNVYLEYKINNIEILNLHTSYLAVSKTPFISGMFHFDENIQRNDGKFMVKILHDYSKIKLIRCLRQLSSGNEKKLENIESRIAEEIQVSSKFPFILEFDGEILTTRKAQIRIFKEKIKECT